MGIDKFAGAMLTHNYHNFVKTTGLLRCRRHIALALGLCGLMACSHTARLQPPPGQSALPPPGDTHRFIPFNATAKPAGPTLGGDCVRDTRNGLIWELKSRQPGLQYRHNTYSWFRRDADDNGGFAGYLNDGHCDGSRCDTEGYVNAINQRQLCGLSQWRLPSRAELTGLVDYRIHYPGPVLDQQAFSNAVAQFYWSATADANDKDSAWGIGFAFGYDYAYFKSDAVRVRLVHDPLPATAQAAQGTPAARTPLSAQALSTQPRLQAVDIQHCQAAIKATAPVSRFLDQGDGTVVDGGTGLMWMRCALGQQWQHSQCTGKPLSVTVKAAHDAAATTRFAGHADWRLPDISELASIAELGCENPALDLRVFPGTAAVNFWSATVFANDPRKQWLMQFLHGENLVDLNTLSAQTRLVRTYSGSQ